MFINTRRILAMIDTGSDMCLMRAECHGSLNAPLRKNKIYFRGVGSNNNETLGEFDAEVRIDDDIYNIKIRIVSDELMRYDFIIGADFFKNGRRNNEEGRNINFEIEKRPRATGDISDRLHMRNKRISRCTSR